jgi:hypothetical protein
MAKQAQAEWTVMVYLAGDNNLDGAGMDDLLEMKQVGSTPQVNIVAQFDRIGAGERTRRYRIKKEGKLEADQLGDFAETNTGDPKVLGDFVAWTAQHYPAKRYMLVLWNHGAGWDDTDIYRGRSGAGVRRLGHTLRKPASRSAPILEYNRLPRLQTQRVRRALFRTSAQTVVEAAAKGGANARAILFDDNAKDFLDNIEMKQVLTRAKKVLGQKLDVLGMDACLMSMAEVAYQVRGGAQFTVGSEELEPGDGWPYDTILAELVKKPTMSGAELSRLVVSKYLASYAPSDLVTQSSCDLAKSETLVAAMTQLAAELTRGLKTPATRDAIKLARSDTQVYDVPDNIDLIHFCKLLMGRVKAGPLADATKAAMDAAKAMVKQSGFKGSSLANSNGLALYFPTRTQDISPLYAKLDFTKKTGWGKFLAAYGG